MMDHTDEYELRLCDSVWCTVTFEAHEGFGGRCPECLAIADEHHANGHRSPVEQCLVCDRIPSLGAARARLRQQVRAA